MTKSFISLAALICVAFSLISLVFLHIMSPEFDPSWRMLSDYANGQHEWVISILFIA